MAEKKQSMSDVICELHSLSLRRLIRDDNQCLLLVKCHEYNCQLCQICELRKTSQELSTRNILAVVPSAPEIYRNATGQLSSTLAPTLEFQMAVEKST